jgi:glycerol-3-phosphate acyltransferase PlsY
LLYVLFAFLCGSIPFAYIFVRLFKGIDVRTVGSGNPGTTNVFRAAGKSVGALTFVCDVLKAFVPVFLAAPLIDSDFIFRAIVASAAIAGHIWTPWLNFKGGKGVASSLGAFLALMPIPSLIAALTFAVVFLSAGIVSLGSMCAAIALVAAAIIFHSPQIFVIFAAIAAIFVILKHMSNIKRLLNGTENKFNIFGRKGKKDE